jgi:hypothetical protein
VLVHHLLGGAGLLLFLRSQGLSHTSACFGAALWMSSGPWLSVANMLNLFCGSAWMPWVLLAAERAVRSRSAGAAVGWGVAVACCMLPGSETVLLAGFTSGAWFLYRGLGEKGRVRLVLVAGLAFVTAVLLTAAQWVPLLALMQRTSRAELPYFVRTQWSLHPLVLLQLPFPVWFQDLPLARLRELTEISVPLFYSIFWGAPVLALAAAGVASRPRQGGFFFATVAALAVVFALGRHARVYDLIVTLLPMLRSIRFPVKTTLLVALAVAALAGFGLEALRRGERGARRRCAVVAAGLWLGLLPVLLFGLAPLEALLAPRADKSVESGLSELALRHGVAFGLTLSFLVLLSDPARRRLGAAWAPGLALLAVAQPLWGHADINETAPAELLRYRPPALDAIRQDGGTRVYSRTRARDTTTITLRQAPLPEGWSWSVAAVVNYKQILFPDVLRIHGLSSSYEEDTRGTQSVEVARLSLPVLGSDDGPWVLKLLQLGAVTHVLALDPKVPEGLQLVSTSLSLLGNHVYLYRVPEPLPRCYVVGGVRSLDGNVAVATLMAPGFEASREVVLTGVPERPKDSAPAGSCRIARFATSRVELDVNAARDAFVVLVDAYSPNWRATLDGQPVPSHRANTAFRAVAVPAGEHRVVWSYAAQTVWYGLAVSLAGAALVAAIVGWERRRRPPVAAGEAAV